MALRPHTSNESDYETLMQRLHISGNSNGNNSVATSSAASPTTILNDSRQRTLQQQQLQQQQQRHVGHQQQQLGEEYRMYERNNIIAASKYATPKQIEQLHLQQQQQHLQQQQQHHSSRLNTEIPLNGIHNTSSSGSAINDHYEITQVKRHSPVYENLDFYQSASPAALNAASTKHFDSINRRAQPQSPAAMGQPTPIQRGHYMVMQSQLPPHANVLSGGGHVLRYAHTPIPDPSDSAPIYENMRIIPNSGQRAQPQASPATATIYQHHNIDVLSSPQHHSSLTPRALQQQHQQMQQLQQQQQNKSQAEHSNDLHNSSTNLDLLASPMHRRSTSNSSLKNSAASGGGVGGMSGVGEPNSPTQRYRNLSLPSHMSNTPASPSKSYASSVSSSNDYKLHQHTPLKTVVKIKFVF